MICIDTNVLLRYLLWDDEALNAVYTFDVAAWQLPQRPAFLRLAGRDGSGARPEQVRQRLLAPDVDEPVFAGGVRAAALPPAETGRDIPGSRSIAPGG